MSKEEAGVLVIQVPATEQASEVYRQVCEYAQTPITPGQTGPGEVIVKEGYRSPYRTGQVLREVLGDDNAVVMKFEHYNKLRRLERSTWVAFSGRRAACYRVPVNGIPWWEETV